MKTNKYAAGYFAVCTVKTKIEKRMGNKDEALYIFVGKYNLCRFYCKKNLDIINLI